MSWFMRLSRFGSAHMVRSQDKEMSCGMASIVMMNFKIKKGLMFAGLAAGAQLQFSGLPGGSYVGQTLSQASVAYAIKSEAEVYKLYEKAQGSPNDFNVEGADPSLYPQVLASLGLGSWEYADVGETGLVQAAINATAGGGPVLVGVTWDGGGGHAVVCDEVHDFLGKKYLCICDPWNGELYVVPGTVGAAVRYDASSKPTSTGTLFGGKAYAYTTEKGKLDGGILRRKV
jgi:hypothetical protein